MPAVDERAREVRPSQVLASARSDHPLHGDAGKTHLLSERDHLLHAFAPLREHAVGHLFQRGRSRIDEVAEQVHFAAVQLARQLDAGDEPHARRL